jgi:hypothetical protein
MCSVWKSRTHAQDRKPLRGKKSTRIRSYRSVETLRLPRSLKADVLYSPQCDLHDL